MATVRHRPRKRFGQHFLIDRRVIERIVSFVQPDEGDVVLEVGPGRGALTNVLVRSLQRLIGVEIDRDLVAMLRERLPPKVFRLIEADVLQLDLARVLREEGGQQLFIIGNLPYNITAPFLFKALDQAEHIRVAVLMLQREVARRLVASPGNKDYGQITVLLAMRAQIELCLEVDRRAFRPVPGVDSSVIKVSFSAQPRFAVRDERAFTVLVRTAFAQRRKMLRNSLQGLVPSGERDLLAEVASVASIELTRRPEELSVEEFVSLSDAFTLVREGGV